MKKALIMIGLAFVSLLSSHMVSYAGEVIPSETPTVDEVLNDNETKTEDSTESETNQPVDNEEDSSYDNLPDYDTTQSVSMYAVEKRVATKGGEALSLVQLVAYIIITILFVVSLIRLVAVHSTGGTDPSLRNAGWGGVVVCCIGYVLVYAGPYLLEFLKNWSLS